MVVHTQTGALGELSSPDAESDPLFNVKDSNSWESEGRLSVAAPASPPSSPAHIGERGGEGGSEGGEGRPLTYNPTAGKGKVAMGSWARKIVGTAS